MSKRTLPQLSPPRESLGRATIMDRGLAARHGVPYVHLAVFAIDVDRIREASEDLDDPRPFAWEVHLTERHIERTLDPKDAATSSMLEDVCAAILESEPSEDGLLGSQLAFAVWHLVDRHVWPSTFGSWFRSWKRGGPRELKKDLDVLFADRSVAPGLARFCLDYPLEPAIAPPTREALAALIPS